MSKFNQTVDPKNLKLYKEILEEIKHGLAIGKLNAKEASGTEQQVESVLFDLSTAALENILGRLRFRNYA